MALCSAPILLIADIQGDIVIETNVSSVDIGGVLLQDQGNGLQAILYYSKKLTGAPHNYTANEWELLSIVIAIKKWRAYIHGKCTWVIADHAPLTALHS